jgi:hypothetical protein
MPILLQFLRLDDLSQPGDCPTIPLIIGVAMQIPEVEPPFRFSYFPFRNTKLDLNTIKCGEVNI